MSPKDEMRQALLEALRHNNENARDDDQQRFEFDRFARPYGHPVSRTEADKLADDQKKQDEER